MNGINDQILARQNKLNDIIESGKQAYPHKFQQKQTIQNIKKNFNDFLNNHVSIQTAGRIMRIARKGKISFYESRIMVKIYN